MKYKFKIMIAMFIMFLIVSMPFVIGDSFAQVNKNFQSITGMDIIEGKDSYTVEQGFGFSFQSIDVPTPENICTEKSQDIENFIDFMENDFIKTLADISSMAYAISTVIQTANTIIAALAIFPGTDELHGGLCKILPYGEAICTALGISYSGMGPPNEFAKWVGLLLVCDKSQFKDVPIFGWCSTNSWFGSKIGNSGGFRLGPFENIYTAVSCLCPTAVLFNLRKLKVIYQTFNCCVKASCEKGISVEGCYRYLDEATCSYWEGSLFNVLWDLVVAVVSRYIGEWLIKLVFEKILQMQAQTVKSLLDVVQGVLAITDLQSTFHFVEDQFNEPDCSRLLDKIGMDYKKTDYGTMKEVAFINDRGIYTSIQ